MIGSPARHGAERVPLSIIANLTGLSGNSLYQARNSGRVSADVAEVLTPIVRAFEAGKLRSKRSSPRSRHPNHWEVGET
jgi:hypothetical protein